MKLPIILTFFLFFFYSTDLVIDFGTSNGKNKDWILISDNIMGGVSKSKLEYLDNSFLLTGTISLDNYGGFSSIKTKYENFDLTDYQGVKIRFKSSNQKFAFTLEESKNWTLPNFKGDFNSTKENTWEVITIYFKDFKEYQVGEPTGNKLKTSNLKNVVRLGIITTDKKEGSFSIEVDYVEFF
jgi:hypothetical protein